MTHHSAGIESFINTEGFRAGVTRQLPETSPPPPCLLSITTSAADHAGPLFFFRPRRKLLLSVRAAS